MFLFSVGCYDRGGGVSFEDDNNHQKSLLHESIWSLLSANYSDASDVGCMGLLLTIVSSCLANHRGYQRNFVSTSVEMI